MLKKVILENYRCYQRHEIEFRDLSIVVGKNNAGKSTLIEALRLLSFITNRTKGLSFHDIPSTLDIPVNYRGVRPSIKDLDFNDKSIFYLYGEPPACILAEFNNNMKIRVYIEENNMVHATIFDGNKPIQGKANPSLLKLPNISVLPQITPLQKEEQPLTEDYVKNNLYSSLASHHFRNQLQFLSEYYKDFVKLSEMTWGGLRITEFIKGKKTTQPPQLPTLLVQDGSFVAEIGWMGHGLQMWLQTMWFLARTVNSATVILDEPDVYMHADLQRKLIRYLKGRGQQVLIATHSIEIISEVEPENILIIDRRKNRSPYASNLPAVKKVVNQIGSIHNIGLARLWSANKLLIVEGKDIAILKRLHDALHPDSLSPLDTIPNLQIGGWGGWNYAIGSNMLLKNAGDETIRTYCIFDRDYHSNEDIKKRYSEAINMGISLYIWKKKEIENYLIAPKTICRFVNNHNKAKKPLLLEVLVSKINSIANSLKDETFDAIASELQSSNKGYNVGRVNKIARDAIQGSWDTEKLSLVSGKSLLKELSQWCNEEFGVSFGPNSLSAAMQPNEIDDEIKHVIKSIEERKDFL